MLSMVSEIKFCLPVGKWGFLSPYAKFPIKMEVDGNFYVFPTVEHQERLTEPLDVLNRLRAVFHVVHARERGVFAHCH